MEEVMMQSNIMAMDKAGNVVLDIESLKQPPDKCCSAMLPLQLDQLKQPLVQNKALIAVPSVLNSPSPSDSGDGRNKRFLRWATIHPRKILLIFATMSSIGTMTLIYFTLAINQRDGV